jgi:hypothetical protein
LKQVFHFRGKDALASRAAAHRPTQEARNRLAAGI